MKNNNKYNHEKIEEIDIIINRFIEKNNNDIEELNSMCLLAYTCINATEVKLKGLNEQGPIAKFWKRITGKNIKIQNSIMNDIKLSQVAALKLIEELLNNQVLTFRTILIINKKLNLTIKNFYKEINSLYASNNEFFSKVQKKYKELSSNIKSIQRNQELFRWSHSIKYQEYNGQEYQKLDDIYKISLIIRDFCSKTNNDLIPDDLILLKTTIDDIGLNNESEITVKNYLRLCIENQDIVALIFSNINISILYKFEVFELPILKSLKEIYSSDLSNTEDVEVKVIKLIEEKSFLNPQQSYELYDFILMIIISLKDIANHDLENLRMDIIGNKELNCAQIKLLEGLNVDDCKHLIQSGVSLNQKINDKYLLHIIKNDDAIKYLIKAGADINSIDDSGFSLLHKEAFGDNLETIIFLKDAGIDLYLKDEGGNIALYYALLMNEDLNFIKIFIDKDIDLYYKNNIGEYIIHYAALYSDNIEIIRYLISKGFPLNVTTKSNLNPIHCAAQLNTNPDIIKLFIKYGVDLFHKDNYMCSPLHLAAGHNENPEVLKVLIQNGIDINSRDYLGCLPIHYAAKNKNPEIIKFVVESGQSINCKTSSCSQPIHIAAKNENIEILKYLIKEGANVNCKDKNGNTPLHEAVYNDNPEIIKYLVDCGVEVNCLNNSGKKPIDIAYFESNNPIIIKTLIEHGAKPIYL